MGEKVLELSDEEVKRLKERLDVRGFRISSIGSPIGKIKITDDFAPHLVDFRRAVYLAHYFGAPYIRIFSFFIPAEQQPVEFRDEVLRRMKELTRIAEEEGVVLLHENEKHIYGDTGERCRDIITSCNSASLRAAFDPANFLQCGVKPMLEAYPLLETNVTYIHIKDVSLEKKQVVPAGEGDGQIGELLDVLKQRDFSGFMSLEPHLKSGDTFRGFSGPEMFVVAIRALKKLLAERDMRWD